MEELKHEHHEPHQTTGVNQMFEKGNRTDSACYKIPVVLLIKSSPV
jgi:hypothetical protein